MQVAYFLMAANSLSHISREVGARAALLYMEIRRCLGLRGGTTIDGTKWIFKTMQELADRFGFSVRDIQRHLKRLVELGWLKRERLDAKQWKQRYWYTYGETDPYTQATSCPVRERQAGGSKNAGRSGSSISSRNGHPGMGGDAPYPIPTAEETAKLLAARRKAYEPLSPAQMAAQKAAIAEGRRRVKGFA